MKFEEWTTQLKQGLDDMERGVRTVAETLQAADQIEDDPTSAQVEEVQVRMMLKMLRCQKVFEGLGNAL